MLRRIRIYLLKRKLRKAYERYIAVSDTLPCGHALSLYTSVRYRKSIKELNAAIANLTAVDSSANIPLVPEV